MQFNSIPELVEDLRQGKMVVLVDDEDRENEGDLVLAADHVSSEHINFMVREARGLVCLSLSPQQVERLQLPLMVRDEQNHTPNKTAFTVSIEAASGVSTGISAADRAHTIRVAANPMAKPRDVHTPGHIFPIRAQQGGVLKRAGHTEGSVDLARLAGLNPAAVICEVMNPDGSMARVKDLIQFASQHQLKIGTIFDLIQYRLRHESLVEEVYSSELNTKHVGKWQLRIFKNKLDGVEHLVLQKGIVRSDRPILTRIQLDNYVRDVSNLFLHGRHPLSLCLQKMSEADDAILLLLRGNNRSQIQQEFEGILEDNKVESPTMDERDLGIGAQILRSLGAHQIRLVTNRPEKRFATKAFEIEVIETVPL